MKIKHESGMVTFEMRAGKDMVRSKMPIGYANSIVSRGKEVKEENEKIMVDDLYFFPAKKSNKGKGKKDE